MNDSDIPKPPDDFSKTTPNIDDKADWGKTNYKYPSQPVPDDWGNTAANQRGGDMDFGRTFLPGSDAPKTPDWGLTQGNIRLPNDDFGATSAREDVNYGATTPYFRLPEAERAKYQNIPPTPAEEAAAKKEEEKQKGGVPTWLWVSGGLFSMFVFALVCLAVIYIFLIRPSGYDVVVKNVPPGSILSVDNSFWSQSQPDGSYILKSLEAEKDRIIKIAHPNFECEPLRVNSHNGVNPPPLNALCKPVKNQVAAECINIKAGAYEVAAKCANDQLDKLTDDFTVDDLLRAMNFYIIQFDVNKYDIPPKNMEFLERASGYMKKLPATVVIEVGGHTDSDGTDASNQVLSENRAHAVHEALLTFGVKPEMLTEKGYGETQPKTTNETADGKFQNRRIQYSPVKR